MLNETINIEMIGEVPMYFGVGLQILFAVLLGGMVGYDREKKMKAAGLKTNMLICLGATLYTSISVLFVQIFTTGPIDPNRVGAQIVSGIGFLGAGAIIQSRGSVVGMTTAATIWVVAAIGYTIGMGFPFSAALFSLTVLVVLKFINPLYRFLERENGTEYFHLQVLSLGSVKRSIMEIVNSEKVEFDEVYEKKIDGKRQTFHIYLHTHPRAADRIINDIKKIASVDKVSCIKVDLEEAASEMKDAEEKVIDFQNTGSK